MVSHSVDLRLKEYASLRDGNALDVPSLLIPKLALPKSNLPKDFEVLSGGGYLAVVHIDGNGAGRMAQHADGEPVSDLNTWLLSEFAIQTRFHGMRVRLRRATQHALKEVFGEWPDQGDRPYQLLMLAGDDLLLVCRASRALPFVMYLCKELKTKGSKGTGSPDQPLTVGAGVAIAQHSLPFHRLQEVAEALCASAKKLARRWAADTNQSVSTVDWQVLTGSLAQDPNAWRQRHAVAPTHQGNAAGLSARPFAVLRPGPDNPAGVPLSSLEALLEKACEVLEAQKRKPSLAARSQLKGLASQFEAGCALAQLAWCELPEPLLKILESVELGLEVGSPWTYSADRCHALTTALDLVDVMEIGRLGKVSAGPVLRTEGSPA